MAGRPARRKAGEEWATIRKLACLFGFLLMDIMAIIALAVTGHGAIASLLGSLPIVIIIAILGFTVDVLRARRRSVRT